MATFDLNAILPATIAWAEARSAEILRFGEPLWPEERRLAERVGVRAPDRIRLALVEAVPFPEEPHLAQAARALGLVGGGILGMTLGYGIYLCRSHRNARLISHECRHVHQYEEAGSIMAFLGVYLQQVATYGYCQAPLERDASAHEIA
jgi:hypothetical protein